MAFNQNSLPIGQVLGGTTALVAGATILPRTGQSITSALAIISLVAGVVVIVSFIVTRILRNVK